MTAVSIVIPTYNEEEAIGRVIDQVISVMENAGIANEIIVVDDGSTDDTRKVAVSSGATVVSHPYNIGNGAAIKTGIRKAQGDVIVMMDGDGQHDPQDIPRLLALMDRYDMVVGARTRDSETASHRDVANWIYNVFATYVTGCKIQDLTSGFRAIWREVARKFVYLLPNTFSYPATLTLATVRSGHSLTYVPIEATRRVGKSKIKLFRDGSRFFLIILKIATLFSPLKVFLPVSIAMFTVGFGYGLFKVVVLGERYGPTSAMLMTMAVLVFLIGLVSEQVAQLRFDRSETFDSHQGSGMSARRHNYE